MLDQMTKTKYEIGEIVYLVTDPDQSRFMITGILIRSSGTVYELSCGLDVSFHTDIEISSKRNNDHLLN
jgi:hypothetical protein